MMRALFMVRWCSPCRPRPRLHGPSFADYRPARGSRPRLIHGHPAGRGAFAPLCPYHYGDEGMAMKLPRLSARRLAVDAVLLVAVAAAAVTLLHPKKAGALAGRAGVEAVVLFRRVEAGLMGLLP